MLATVHPTLNDHVYDMRPTCVVHVIWHYFILESSTPFSWVPWSVLWLCHQLVTDVTAWLIDPNPSCSKNRKWKWKRKKNKLKRKEKRKVKSTLDDLDNILPKQSIILFNSQLISTRLINGWNKVLSSKSKFYDLWYVCSNFILQFPMPNKSSYPIERANNVFSIVF